MLSRIVGRSLTRRRRRKLLGTAAVALGIAVTTTVAMLSLDVGDKVNHELRGFGANISVTPAADSLSVAVGGVDYRPAGAGAYLAESDLPRLKTIFWRNNIVAFTPFLSAPATLDGHRVAVVGSWFEYPLAVGKNETFTTGMKALHPSWRIRGDWPVANQQECLVGERLARELGVAPGKSLTLRDPQDSVQEMTLRVSGIVETGASEDDEVLAPLAAVQKFTGLAGKIRRVEVSALTKPEDAFARSDVTKLSATEFDRWFCTPYVSSISYQIQQAIPGSEARPVYRVAETEGKILHSVGVLMAILAATSLLTAALAVASMMFASVLERRVEIGLFKSLGATDARVASIFYLEAMAVGLVGGLVGFGIGSVIAWRISAAVFGSSISMHWVILPVALALATIVSIAGSAVPVERGLKFSPVAVLRNE